jgi:hypothetical protein
MWLPSQETAVGTDRFMRYIVYDLPAQLDYIVMADAHETTLVYGPNLRVHVLL